MLVDTGPGFATAKHHPRTNPAVANFPRCRFLFPRLRMHFFPGAVGPPVLKPHESRAKIKGNERFAAWVKLFFGVDTCWPDGYLAQDIPSTASPTFSQTDEQSYAYQAYVYMYFLNGAHARLSLHRPLPNKRCRATCSVAVQKIRNRANHGEAVEALLGTEDMVLFRPCESGYTRPLHSGTR